MLTGLERGCLPPFPSRRAYICFQYIYTDGIDQVPIAVWSVTTWDPSLEDGSFQAKCQKKVQTSQGPSHRVDPLKAVVQVTVKEVIRNCERDLPWEHFWLAFLFLWTKMLAEFTVNRSESFWKGRDENTALCTAVLSVTCSTYWIHKQKLNWIHKKNLLAACWPSFADVPWVMSLLPISADQVPASVPPPTRQLLLIKAE